MVEERGGGSMVKNGKEGKKILKHVF